MSTFVLPQPVGGTATGWTVVDYLDRTYRSDPADATGTATLTLPQLDAGVMWNLTHMVCSSTSIATTRMRLYLDSPDPSRLRDGSDTGNFDVADWPLGLQVPPASSVVVQWTGADPGATGTITLQGQLMRQAPAS